MRRYSLTIKGKEYVIDVQEMSANQFRVMLEDLAYDVELTSEKDLAEARITPQVVPTRAGDEAVVERPAATYRPPHPDTLERPPQVSSPALPSKPHLATDGVRMDIMAPMPGVIQSILVEPGDEVTHGQTVVVLEAMKMKNAIKSPRDGVVAEVPVHIGQTVKHGDVLVRFEEV